jgi:sensor histidine kinase YesM
MTLALTAPQIKKIFWQTVFWTITYFILLTIFSGSSEWQKIDHIYTAIFMVTLMLSVSVNARVILPNFLSRKKYPFFFLLSGINVIVFAFFNHFLFDKLIDYLLPGYYFISYYDFADLLKFFVALVAITTLIELSMEWFTLQETRHRLMTIEKEKVAAELRALTNQVNPHFLFNSLTVLYSLALKDSKETSNAIIQLSDILRYVIYESGGGVVSLKSEIGLIRNYISLQRYRVHPSMKINFESGKANENLRISSMLFLPLVENGFKHGIEGDVNGAFLDIRLETAGGVITFIIRNSCHPVNVAKINGGVGLKNIQDRLKLMYADKHSLTITETPSTFEVAMQLTTD